MSKIFLTSDTHFNHGNIIKYCNRPYANVENMNEAMIESWNRFVGKDDIVYHLGDFAMGSKDEIERLVARLNGRIKLVKGNHDNYKPAVYRNLGFAEVYDKPIIIENFWILSHAPIEGMVGKNIPFCNIYGHVHDDARYTSFARSGICVCVERWGYVPVDFEFLKKEYQKKFF